MSETALAKKELSMSERFMNKVILEFTSGVGDIALTEFQKRLAQNYFVSLDATLKISDEKRAKKSEKYRDPLPITWANVNMESLSRNVVAVARIGLDPMQKNHINMMPFKNNATNQYDIVFVEGYRGIELKAKKYGLDVPDSVIVELVYSGDKFKSIKKDGNHPYESYEFDIGDDFNRGDIVGGFYFHFYLDAPEKNKLVVMALKDILKRKPAYASAEFWGGEKDVWENGKKTGKEHTDGWYEKMCYKTVYRSAYNDITIDSQKIDDDYLAMRQIEMSLTELKVAEEIDNKANKGPVIDIPLEFVDEPKATAPESEAKLSPTGTEGPDF